MKAIVRDAYGPPEVLRLVDIERPVPGPGDGLVGECASSLNRADRYVLEGIPLPFRLMLGLFRPRERGLGTDFAGEVVEVGGGVTDVGVGDEVYGQIDLGSTWAEYAVVAADLVAPKPGGLTWTQAAAVPLAGFTALQGLRDAAGVQPGQSVLLNGSTGAVGTSAVQVACALGARVTAVCSRRHADLVRDLGADEVIPYEERSFLDCGAEFDVLFDIVGNHSVWACRRVLKRTGVFTVVGGPESRLLGPVPHILGSMLLGMVVPQRVATFTGTPNRADLLVLTEWIEAGKLRPVVSRTFPFEETAAALRYLTEGRPGGKVALAMGH